MKQFLAFFLTAAVAFGALADEVYKWVDENGTTHFSAQPPTDREYEVITPSAGRVGTVDPTQQPESDGDSAESSGDPQAPLEVEESEPDPEEVAQRCEQARENLFWLTERRRVSMRDEETGEETWLDDDERLDMIDETEAYLREHCR